MVATIRHREEMDHMQVQAAAEVLASIPADVQPFRRALTDMVMPENMRPASAKAALEAMGRRASTANAFAKAYREGGAASQYAWKERARQVVKSGALAKAGPLDVGTNVNFSQITGGQSIGYVSLDTQLARGTIRPDSFALYQSLPKSQAFQIVDFWAYSDDIGSTLPATNFQSFGSVSSGTLSTSAGLYQLDNITLRLAANGRAITTALAAQNNFVDIAAQENANAALSILQDFDWASFWGNNTLYPNQPNGLYSLIPTGNIFNFQTYVTDTTYAGLSNDQLLFNLIYDITAQVTSFGNFGHITHAFMDQNVIASLQSLTTTLLNNIVNVNSFGIASSKERNLRGQVINGDLDGMLTRFGQIRFPVDILLTARDAPAQARVLANGTTPATSSGPTPPTTVTTTVNTSAATSGTSYWTSAYTGQSGWYQYAVAATNAQMMESNLTYAAPCSGITVGGSISVNITGSSTVDYTVYRVYRSGLLGTAYSGGVSGNPASFRYVGSVAANGVTGVVLPDNNAHIPGSSTIFLLDMDENDRAIDFRYLLPLTKVELFAQNLFMPWCVAMIGAPRLRVAKYHAIISNYTSDQANWSPLQPNPNATFNA